MSAGGRDAGERDRGRSMVQTAPKAKAVAYPQADQTQVSKQAKETTETKAIQRTKARCVELMVSATCCAGTVCCR